MVLIQLEFIEFTHTCRRWVGTSRRGVDPPRSDLETSKSPSFTELLEIEKLLQKFSKILENAVKRRKTLRLSSTHVFLNASILGQTGRTATSAHCPNSCTTGSYLNTTTSYMFFSRTRWSLGVDITVASGSIGTSLSSGPLIIRTERCTAESTRTTGLLGILQTKRSGKVQIVGCTWPWPTSQVLITRTHRRARDHIFVGFVGNITEFPCTFLELTTCVWPVREKLTIWRDAAIGLAMVPVAYADARILNVGIVVSSSDHTALLKKATKMPRPIKKSYRTWYNLDLSTFQSKKNGKNTAQVWISIQHRQIVTD